MTPVRLGFTGIRNLASRQVASEHEAPICLAWREALASLRHSLSPAVNIEAENLSLETDPDLLAEGVLGLAGRLSNSQSAVEQGAALQFYELLRVQGGAVAERAGERAAVLTGSGAFGGRAERLLRGFAQQASDPAMLLGMGLASTVFSLTRAVTLSRLLAGPSLGWASRGFGTRALASAAGFVFEAPTFVLGTRLGGTLLGRDQDWSRQALARDFASSYLALGAMRLAHAGAAALPRPGTSAFGLGLFQQTATLGGLWLGHGMERAFGLRSSRDPAWTLADSLTMLLQFHVAGRLSGEFLGQPYARWNAALEAQSRVLSPRPVEELEASLLSDPAFALATAHGSSRAPTSAEPPPPSNAMAMSSLGKEGPSGARVAPSIETRFDQLVRPEFRDAAANPVPRKGPRRRSPVRRIGILTSGGDGPGENAAVEALVRGAIQVHHWEPLGIFDGYRGLLEPQGRIRPLNLADVSGEASVRAVLQRLYAGRLPVGVAAEHGGISTLGGDFLRSSRTNPVQGDPQASRVKQTLKEYGIDAVVVLGGNGSMRAADALRQVGVPVVGIPQSIDLDVWGSEHSIGFPSAVAKGAAEVHHFQNTAHSCDRWFLVEVMGQHYGMLTLAVGRESRAADSVFIEVPRPLSDVRDLIERYQASRAHGVLLFSEGVKFQGAGVSVIEPPRGTDVHGRLVVESGDVVRWLRAPLAEMGITHTRPESLGYLLRGADPTSHEIALAERLSEGALKLVEAGQLGRMVGTGFVGDSSDLQLVYPRLSRVARLAKPPPVDYFHYVRTLLEGQ